ncbi:transporter substrate-binding domain-containing protein [Lachnospiraceae bacterium 45-P1]
MKKSVLIAMAAALSMTAMAGCSNSKDAAATTAAAAETTVAAGTTAAAGAAETTTAGAAAGATTEAAGAAGEQKELDPDCRLAKVLKAGKFVIGTSPDFAPMEFKDVSSGKTEFVGSDIELAKYIADKLGVELEIKAMEFSAIQQAVASGTIDAGISGFAYTEERAKSYGTSVLYNVQSDDKGHTCLVLKENASAYKTAEDFAGKKILAQNASLQQNLVSAQLPSDIAFQPVTAVTDGVMMLITGKADALAVSWDNGEMLMKSYPEIAMTEFKFDHEDGGNIVLMGKEETELIEAINEIIEEVNESGIYAQWTDEAQALAEKLGIGNN